ncbi:MAG: hypothetical protein WCE21_03015, partial [Candidatus Babeliales bacterium]
MKLIFALIVVSQACCFAATQNLIMITQFDEDDENISQFETNANLTIFINAVWDKKTPILVNGHTLKKLLIYRIIAYELSKQETEKTVTFDLENFIKQNYPKDLISPNIDTTIKKQIASAQNAIKQYREKKTNMDSVGVATILSHYAPLQSEEWYFYDINNSGYYLCVPTNLQYTQHIKLGSPMIPIPTDWLRDTTFITNLVTPHKGDDATFVDTVLKVIMPSADPKIESVQEQVQWYLLLLGHGIATGTESTRDIIASFTIETFRKLLLFFNNLGSIKTFTYVSCDAGGHHLKEPYELLNQKQNLALDLNYT